jgi:hypothetical protein
MSPSARNYPEGLWLACASMEAYATAVVSRQLEPIEAPIRECYESGVQVPTLPGKRHGTPDMLLAALFLKKSLNDLRSTWLLLQHGYTSQAAAVAASLFENALTVTCLAGNEANARILENHDSDGLPWSIQQMAKIHSRRQQNEARAAHLKSDSEVYETTWREVYAGYIWLCKIKHPTSGWLAHDASSTSGIPGEHVVRAAPDVRSEDIAVKATILAIAIHRVHGAIHSYALALECDTTSPEYLGFVERMRRVPVGTSAAFRALAAQPLPFDIHESVLAQDWARLKSRQQ